ncbi:tRNA(Ile)-lysidine synthase [Planifilum fimeticola]|uniref:tRNA(Ile)-lysidine synthase n=1 Tax=Planifilum fimeticola TaxID=201975 RepID=A0A2T0LCW4_9BACL|nr:tRNA lysidine(34) synthetase TilS [Planifilum fimeticola]PRX39875.1 tRNA(Ile)-lysidine synthase [Planifilum fimeticola]
MTFRERLRESIRRMGLLERGDTVLVGVSGGPDSMALLHALWRLSAEEEWNILAVHVNHQLRGKASEADQAYVESRCREWGIPCDIRRVDVSARLRERGGNLQDVARRLRYDAFREAAAKAGADKLALAHQADDQVETVLMRFLRGTGVGGLAGIPPSRPWYGMVLVRPLLPFFREEIEAYCREEGLHPRRDESNDSLAYTRNRLRHRLIPQLAEYNPRVKEAILKLSLLAAEEEKVWERLEAEAAEEVTVRRGRGEITLDVSALGRQPLALQRRLIKLHLNCLVKDGAVEIPMNAVDRVLSLAEVGTGSRLHLPGNLEAEREYGRLRLRRAEADSTDPGGDALPLAVPGVTSLPHMGGAIEARVEERPLAAGELSGRWAVFDADRLEHPLCARPRRPGDRMRLLGLSGSKKVKEIMIDAKVPRRLRSRLPMVIHGEEIIWIPGLRRSDWAPVTNETRRFLYLMWLSSEEEE